MEVLSNKILIDYYYKKFNLDQLFTNDIKSNIKLYSYERHEHIYVDTEKITHFHFFVKGKAKVYNTLSNGKSLLLCFYKPLMLLGDLELLNTKVNSSNVQALEECHCLSLPMSYAKEYLANDIKFMKYVNYSLSKKLDQCSLNNTINLLYKLENRLASYILSTSISMKINDLSTLVFDENLTNVAELLGTSYRHLLRTLSLFCKENVLRKDNNFYEIIDISYLEDLATDLYK